MFVVAAMALAFEPFAMTMPPPMPEPIMCPEDEITWHATSEAEWRATRRIHRNSGSTDLWSLAKGIFNGDPPVNYVRSSAFTMLIVIGAFLCSICTRQRLSLDIYNPCDPDYISRSERALTTWERLWRKHPRAEQSMTRLDDPLLNDCLSLLGSSYYHLYVGEELVVLKQIAENPACGLGLPAYRHRPETLKVIRYAANSWLVRAKLGVQYLRKAGGLDLGSQQLSSVYETGKMWIVHPDCTQAAADTQTTALILAWWFHVHGDNCWFLTETRFESEEERVAAKIVSRILEEISTEIEEQETCYKQLSSKRLDPLGFYVFMYEGLPWERSSVLAQRLRNFAWYIQQQQLDPRTSQLHMPLHS